MSVLSVKTNIYRRAGLNGKAPSWYVRWKDPGSGLWLARRVGRTKEEARIVELSVREKLLLGKPVLDRQDPSSQKGLISGLIDRYLNSARFKTLGKGTQQNAQFQMETIIGAKFGHFRIQDLSKDELYAYYISLRDKGIA